MCVWTCCPCPLCFLQHRCALPRERPSPGYPAQHCLWPKPFFRVKDAKQRLLCGTLTQGSAGTMEQMVEDPAMVPACGRCPRGEPAGVSRSRLGHPGVCHSCAQGPPVTLLWPVLVTLAKAALWNVVLKGAILLPRDTAVLLWNGTWLSARLHPVPLLRDEQASAV